ncbi:MAG: bifunctional glutamate N-acetyltransferase/amino-acid acetyltransferase ArgJ [Clostridium sp.]|jgi:glutamate N-acetyltransferase/amino-acid N-acetyltransferase|nr:bifunctional glutamate N-acetyltransferase/amino-acid acetyltransferase ArgJ [Clostridium sp.]
MGIKTTEGGVTAPKGFEAAGVEAGIKYQGRKDVALIYSTVPSRAAGVFTTNVVKAAPVLWDQKQVAESAYAQAVIINSGIANACTGRQGRERVEEQARHAAAALRIPESAVLVASTGVIGMQIPGEKIKEGIRRAAAAKGTGREAARSAAQAIMTTDTLPKEAAVSVEIGGKTVTIGGMCKGSGMIHPNMCTMLAFVTTDACISKELLQKCLRHDVQDTFNMVSVDGDTSTNDTLLALANGLAGNPEITREDQDYDLFRKALREVNTALAKQIAKDGEGATALLQVTVKGAAAKEEARKLAKSVVCSSLTKAAIFGHDANWGRILCALGYAGVSFDPENLDLSFQSEAGHIPIYGGGVACGYSEEEAARILSAPEVTVTVDMHMGTAEATAWGCDLSYDYVKINADYRS